VLLAPFFDSYPELKKYEGELVEIYRNYNFNYIWFSKKSIAEYGNSLYSKVQNIEDEGIYTTFPYQKDIDDIFKNPKKYSRKQPGSELLLTGLYLFYVNEVYKGIDHSTTTDIGWLLQRKKLSNTGLLDTIISDQELQHEDSLILFSQYYQLRDALKRYRGIEKNGGWIPIKPEPDHKGYKPNDSSGVIRQIRERLYVSGEIKKNNKSNVYDDELQAAVTTFQTRNGFKPDPTISAGHIEAMNIPVGEYIKIIVVNMERCRWITPEIFKAKEFIFSNIPSYRINLFRDGKIEFDSPVVVGEIMTKTVIFDGKMSYIVFSPYWNLPKSIIENEVMPGIEKDKRYLENHHMEWNDGQVRQLPGKNNSLGLVKFMFPNSNDIYFHDSPAKSLYNREDRALSHGCVRVGKARELAIKILENDEDWPVEKIDAAINAGEETICSLKNKIPVYIGYFTAWVDEQGQVNFYKDIYERDEKLAELLFYKK
jgi:murein L,D-transpeptidase YcbB/YkuD